jgi:hypothetical protein
MLIELKEVLSIEVTLNAKILKQGMFVCVARHKHDKNYGCESLTYLLNYK